MHSLFFRIFILFWIAMALIVGGSMAVTVAVASRESETPETERRPEMALRAAQVLAHGGLAELRPWLKAHQDAIPRRDFFIVDAAGRDILGRTLSEFARRRLDFLRHNPGGEPHPPDGAGHPPPHEGPPHEGPPHEGPPPGGPPLRWPPDRPLPANLWPGYASPQIIAADGAVYTLLFSPRPPGLFGALSLPGIPLAVLALALLVSALASGWLARHFSAPIRRLQEGARSVASEQLEVRVSAGLEDRRDELAVLARDFDAMADKLRTTRTARTQLLRDISHELRSPLARMRLAVGLARQSSTDRERQLDRMELEIERLDSLISQVLKLARLQGAVAPELERLELDELLEDVVADARYEAAPRECRIELGGDRGLVLLAHRELLRSALENVLRNAVRYSPRGGCIELDTQRRGADVGISIRDRGPGVPEQDLQKIFEPFYRVAESRDRDSGGEGIGLAITAQVMQAHGGSASARNRVGGGLEVRLTLPASPAGPVAAGTVAARTVAARA
ncbi:MAG: ATP-binding protein [Steroidobacteraceae bacterium]